MISNNLAKDSPDRWHHNNVLRVVSGSELLRSIVMRDILTPFLPSFFLECHGLMDFTNNCIVYVRLLCCFIVFSASFCLHNIIKYQNYCFCVEIMVKLLFHSICLCDVL